jgi:non-ribosomal peptide synthetase component F
VVATNVEDIYPLSSMQQGMLLHTLQDSSGDMYLMQDVYIIDGPLDTDLLIEAWQHVFAAHPALRTSFQWDGLDHPLQIVHRSVTPPTRRDDWRGQPEDEQLRRLDELLSKDRAAGFDLTVPPLQRLLVVRLDDQRFALAWTHHHLLMDGWSVPLFMNEVMSHYRRLAVGGPAPAPAPPFRDYIAWLDRQDMDAARKFWSDSLGDVKRRPLRGLRPVDPRRPNGESLRRIVDVADTIEDGMRATAARHRVTPTTVLDAAWAVVLDRHADSAGAEVVVGCVSSGRSAELPGADRMLGVLINTLPVAVTVPEDAELGEWLRDIHSREAAARAYEYSPLAEIKKWVGAPGRQLFDSIVVHANYDFGVVDDGPLIVRSQNTFDKISVPLAVTLTPKPVSQLQLIWHEGRLDEATVDALFAGLLAALDAIGSAERTSSILAAVAATVPAVTPEVSAPSVSAGVVSSVTSPVTPLESAIAAAWCDVLGIADVDVTANFFDLGGDSFSAVRAVSRIEGATVALLALNPTVRDLAIAIGSLEPEDQELDAEIEELERRLAATKDPARPEDEARGAN